jgi:hypothetical protein
MVVVIPLRTCKQTNKNEPRSIQEVIATKEGDDLLISFVLVDSHGEPTSYPGAVWVYILEEEWSDEADDFVERSFTQYPRPVYIDGYSCSGNPQPVSIEDFCVSQVGTGNAQQIVLHCSFERIELRKRSKQTRILIDLGFLPDGYERLMYGIASFTFAPAENIPPLP